MHAFNLRIFAAVFNLAILLRLVAAPQPSITTDGLITNAFQIDALVWTNRGTISFTPDTSVLSEALLSPVFETQNTIRYVNRGSLSAYPGFRFETVNDFGVRTPAADFINEAGRSILSEQEVLTFDLVPIDFGNPTRQLYGGFITINASNIVNRGLISTASGGDIRIWGENVDLRRGGVGNQALRISSFDDSLIGFFVPEVGVEDVFWFYGNDARVFYGPGSLGGSVVTNEISFGPVAESEIVATPSFNRMTPFMGAGDEWREPILGQNQPGAFRVFCWTNQINPTNKIVEVAFVRTPDPNVLVDVGWAPSSRYPEIFHRTAVIRFSSFGTNLLTSEPESSHLVLIDNYASETLEQLLNNVEIERAFRPTNIFLLRGFDQNVNRPLFGSAPNAEFFPEIYSQWIDGTNFPAPGVTMTNGALVPFTDGGYATWAARVDSLPSRTPVLPIDADTLYDESIFSAFLRTDRFQSGFLGPTRQSLPQASFTNFSGRVYVDAKNLNLERARLQARGTLTVKTDNLISATNATLEAPIISLDLGVQPRDSRELVVRNMMRSRVTRLGGNFVVLSYAFSNFFTMTVTNATGTPLDTNGDGTPDACDTNGDGMPDSNEPCPTDGGGGDVTHNAFYHVTVVDSTIRANQLQYVDRLELHADAARIMDDALIQKAFLVDSKKLTIEGGLSLDGITNFSKVNMPNVKDLTISESGAMYVPGLFTLGLDRPGELDRVSVAGTLAGSSMNVMAGTVENAGVISGTGGQTTIQAGTFSLTAGEVSAAFEVTVAAAKATLSGGSIFSSGEVLIDVTDELTDGGIAEATTILNNYGVRIARKPAIASINGVTVNTEVPEFAEAVHEWPGEDLGASRAGFVNNLSLKELVLDGGTLCTLTFRGTGLTNALYVETLTISDGLLADLDNVLNIEPSLTIYYANTSTNIPPELLDNAFGGRLIYVKEGGPNDENRLVPVQLGDGRTVNVAYKLRSSTTVDSDNDGIPNGLDTTPFDSVKVSEVKVNAGADGVEIYWNALPGARYEVQASADFGATSWQTIKTLQNDRTTQQLLRADDPLGSGNSVRVYRVIITP